MYLKKITFPVLILSSIFFYNASAAEKPKLIGLMQVRNEEDIVTYALRALYAIETDEIIVLDDGSTDKTVNIVKSLAKSFNITKIIVNSSCGWKTGSEVTNRQALLTAGRARGGTHFISIDADEIPVSKDNQLKKSILSLLPGQTLQVPLINLWKGFDNYRSACNNLYPDVSYCVVGYCDDGIGTIASNLTSSYTTFLHFARFPLVQTLNSPLCIYDTDLEHGIIHLPFVNYQDAIIKKAWMLMLELVRQDKLHHNLHNPAKFPNGRTFQDICNFYEAFHNYKDINVILSPVPSNWLNYSWFDTTVKNAYINRVSTEKVTDIKNWVTTYGRSYFNQSSFLAANLDSILAM